MSNKGFASLSKQQRKLVSQKAGRVSQASGAGHKLNHLTARAAAMKGVATRQKKAARAAALVLLEAGFSAEHLHALSLSEEELIYYGGASRSGTRLKELVGRLENVLKRLRDDDEIKSNDPAPDPAEGV